MTTIIGTGEVGALHSREELEEMQRLPLQRKIQITTARIIEWYQHYDGKVYVAFSGGKDSTVLLDIVRRIYPDVPAVFSDTGLEFPEVREFVKSCENVTIVRPEMNFRKVIEVYGYPVVSKRVADTVEYGHSLLTQLACNSLDNDIGTWLFSGELPNGVEKSWFNYIFAGPRNITDAISRRGNPYKKISTTTLAEINKTYKGRWHIYRDDYDNTLDKLIASMTDTVRKYGARCLILDNFMCIDTETSEEELRSQTDTIKKLIEFAKKYQVAVILVCHPRKMDAGTNVGIYDIAGTSNIVNLAHRTIGLRRVTDAERENAAKYSEKRRQLLKYDVIVTIVKDRMFGRQNIDVGLYYDSASRRFFSDMDEYDRRFSWDKKEYKEPLPLPPQLLAEERASEDEAFGAVNDREG